MSKTSRINARVCEDAKKLGPKLTFCAAVGSIEASGDAPSGTFSMVAYSGGVLHQTLGGRRVPVVIDLDTAQIEAGKQYPALLEHSGKHVPGYLYAKVENGQIVANGNLVNNDEASRVRQMAKDGFEWQASVGMEPVTYEPVKAGVRVTVNGKQFTGPILVARSARLREVSFVAVGADAETSVSLAASYADESQGREETMSEFDQFVQASGFDPETLTDAQKGVLEAAFAHQSLKAKGEAQVPFDAEEIVKKTRDVSLGELSRIGKIKAAAEEYAVSTIKVDGKEVDFAQHAIKAGWSALEAENVALRASRENVPLPRGSARETAIDQDVIEASLLLAGGVSEDFVAKSYADEKRARVMNEATSVEWRNLGVQGLLKATCDAAGLSVGRFGDDVSALIERSAEANRRLQASGEFTTLSLPGVLSNVANKTLLSAYQSQPLTWNQIAATTSLRDFKQATRYRFSVDGTLSEVGPDGELKHINLQEDSRTIRLKTEGAMISLTRQMIINDDLGAFLRIPSMFGRQAAVRIEKQVYQTLLSAVDSTLFTTAQGNLVEGTANVLGITGLTAAKKAFHDQTDENGDPISVMPEILLVGTALDVTADTLLNSTEVRDTTASTKYGVFNPHARSLRKVMSPYLNAQSLSGSSATLYFLLANPSVLPVIEVGFLNGRNAPVIESSEADFNVLGMKWRAYIDFGIAEGEYRGGVAVTGVAA